MRLYLQRCLLGREGDDDLRARVRAAWPGIRDYQHLLGSPGSRE
ncbi:hypothetical protein [Actinoplanes campanulatus]|nr:hypothetical protein [Actinoplanes capillaceus]